MKLQTKVIKSKTKERNRKRFCGQYMHQAV